MIDELGEEMGGIPSIEVKVGVHWPCENGYYYFIIIISLFKIGCTIALKKKSV